MSTETTTLPQTEFHCAQCGGVLHPDEGQIFLECPYCGSAVYLDKSKVVFHWSLRRTVDPDAAAASLRRWMAGNETVKDLDRKSTLISMASHYFPVWYVKAREGNVERVFVEPAAATSISALKSLAIPSGDLQKYDSALDADSIAPTVPFPAMLKWLAARGVESNEIVEAALVHLPIYVFKYQFGGRAYMALIEGASGKVFANIFPAKVEAPYRTVAVVATAGFLCVSGFPVVGFLTAGAGGAMTGALACLIGGALFAVPVFALAAYVSAKV